MLISVLDSYFSHVKRQMATLNAQVTINGNLVSQPFGGVTNARDWPQTPPIEGALYLLFLSAVPRGGSQAQREYEYFCQWVWIIIGKDIGAAAQAANRGDKYRQGLVIQDNLRQANYPGYCQKMDYTADAQGNVSSAASASLYPVSSVESIHWTPLRFIPKTDEKSGLVYGAAAVELYGYDDVSVLVA